MKIRLDAVVAEIATTIDVNLLRQDPSFEALPRFNRMHFIMGALERHDIARADRSGGRKVIRWRPSRTLESSYGLKRHGIPEGFERIERPIALTTLADELSEFLQANGEAIEQVTSYVLGRFAMYKLGLLEYRGKKGGVCQFDRSSRRIDVIDETGNIMDFVEKYGSQDIHFAAATPTATRD